MTPLYNISAHRPLTHQPEFSSSAYQAQRNSWHPKTIFYRHGHDRPDTWGYVYDAARRINRFNPAVQVAMVLPNVAPESLRIPVRGCGCVLYQAYRDDSYVAELSRALFAQGAEVLAVVTLAGKPKTQVICPEDLDDAA